MLRGKSIIKIKDTDARGRTDPPHEIAVERCAAKRITTTVEEQNTAAPARLRHVDSNRRDPVGFERVCLSAFGWCRDKGLNPAQPLSSICRGLEGAATLSVHKPQRNAQKLGVPTNTSWW